MECCGMLSPTYLECMKINAEIHQPLADLLSDTSSLLITDFCFKCTLNKQTYFKSYLPLAVTCLVASCIPLLGKNVFHRQREWKQLKQSYYSSTTQRNISDFPHRSSSTWMVTLMTRPHRDRSNKEPGDPRHQCPRPHTQPRSTYQHKYPRHHSTLQGNIHSRPPPPQIRTDTQTPLKQESSDFSVNWSHSVLSLLYRRAFCIHQKLYWNICSGSKIKEWRSYNTWPAVLILKYDY